MRRPQIESRSLRYAARQYVSDYEESPREAGMSELAKERSKGVVKFFNAEKGFGFCRRDGKPDVFLHQNALKRSGIYDGVVEGDTLEFDVEPVVGKGPKASEIKVLEKAPRPEKYP